MNTVIKAALLLVLLVPIAVLGCSSDDPLGPENFGVVIYERDGFEGDYTVLTGSVLDLEQLGGPCEVFIDDVVQDSLPFPFDTGWANCISSIQIPTGWTVWLYERDGFEGDYTLPLTVDLSDLDELPSMINPGLNGLLDWDNKASSIAIQRN